jgi:hypothetical protein
MFLRKRKRNNITPEIYNIIRIVEVSIPDDLASSSDGFELISWIVTSCTGFIYGML